MRMSAVKKNPSKGRKQPGIELQVPRPEEVRVQPTGVWPRTPCREAEPKSSELRLPTGTRSREGGWRGPWGGGEARSEVTKGLGWSLQRLLQALGVGTPRVCLGQPCLV